MRKSSFFTYLLGFLLTFVSCGGDEIKQSKDSKLKAALLVENLLMDGGFNELALGGLKRAEKELDYQISYQSAIKPSLYESSLEALQEVGNDIIVLVGFNMWEALKGQVDFHKNQNYAIIDFIEIDTPRENVLPVTFKAEQGAFLAGYIAGKTTKTHKVGFVGGVRSAIVDMFDYGFEAGALYANPNVQVVKQYAETFADPGKGKNIANLLYQSGVDILFHAAGGTGLGVIEAAKELKKTKPDIWVIGVDTDQSSLAPEAVLISVIKRVDNAVYKILEDLKQGNFNGGEPCEYGIEDGGVGLSEHGLVSEEIMREVSELEEKIRLNEIVPPYDSKGMVIFSRNYLKN